MDLAALDSDFAEGQSSMTAEERLRIINDTIAEVRPYVQADGGDIELVGIEGHRVKVPQRLLRDLLHGGADAPRHPPAPAKYSG